MPTCLHHRSCVRKAIHKAESICQDRGLRFTELRRKVLKMIWGSHSSAKAYDILNMLKGEHASAKPPTVYRALDFLMANGLVHKLNSLNSYVGCSHPLQHNECYFLICGDCGEIKECCNSQLANAIAHTADRNQFKPRMIAMEIKGKCKECATHRSPQ